MLTILLVFLLSIYINKANVQAYCHEDPKPNYPFLKYAPYQAVRAFRGIVMGMEMLPRVNVTMKMKDWADKYNMTNEFEQYLMHRADVERRRQEMIETIVEVLPDFLTAVENVKRNVILSAIEASEELHMLFTSVNRSLAGAACCIYTQIQVPNRIRHDSDYSDYYYDDDYSEDYNYINEDASPRHYAGFDLSRKHEKA